MANSGNRLAAGRRGGCDRTQGGHVPGQDHRLLCRVGGSGPHGGWDPRHQRRVGGKPHLPVSLLINGMAKPIMTRALKVPKLVGAKLPFGLATKPPAAPHTLQNGDAKEGEDARPKTGLAHDLKPSCSCSNRSQLPLRGCGAGGDIAQWSGRCHPMYLLILCPPTSRGGDRSRGVDEASSRRQKPHALHVGQPYGETLLLQNLWHLHAPPAPL